MKQKLISLLTLLVLCVTGAWAANDDPGNAGSIYLDIQNYATIDAVGINTGAYTLYGYSETDGNGYLVVSAFEAYKSKGKQKWVTDTGESNQNSTWSATGVFKGSDFYFKKVGSSDKTANCAKTSTARAYSFKVTNCTGVHALVQSAKGANVTITAYPLTESELERGSVAGSDSDNSKSIATISVTGLDKTKIYEIVVNAADSNNNFFYEIAFVTPATPSLVGAWEISSTDVTGETVNVVQGAAAPTIPTFTVGATSGTPMASNYSVAYSLKAGSTEGIFTYTSAGGPTAISTATAGSATLVATLTTTDDAAFLTPATNTFEYTVVVSEAHAPSIAVIGAGNVARGGELIMNANVTEAVPKISYIKWYACDSEGNIDGDALGEELNYAPSTSSVGTYYYRAVVNNGIGGDVNHDVYSAVQTIIIVPKAPTMTAGGVFVTDSKDIEIVKDEDEDDSAVIKYSIDNGESWADFTSPTITITSTTTVKARVVQDGLESDVVTATFTKKVLDEQTNISSYTKWDWADLAEHYTANINGTDIKMANDSQGDSKGVDVLMSNIPKYGRYTIDYPSSFDAKSLLFNGEYPVRKQGENYVGGAVYLKITTTVPGILTITYADNGNNNRYVRVTDSTNEPKNGDPSESTTDYKTKSFEVAAGDIRIAGYDGSNETYIRFKTIIFQPTTTVTVGTKGYATYVNSDYTLDFTGKSIKAYTIGSANGTALTLTQKDKVAKDEPVLLYSNTESDSQTIPAIADGEATVDATNKLVAGDGNTHTYEVGVTEHYILYTGGEKPGFYQANNSLVAEGKAYLDLTSVGGGARILNFDLFMEDGVATGIAEMKSVNAENNGIFNLRGQRVAQPQKGLYIMNGKKVVVK